MFTGIIEVLGDVLSIEKDLKNIHFTIQSAISSDLKIDQSLSHNGVCLTVVKIEGDKHRVTAIDETLKKSNLSDWKIGDKINLERCMLMNGRIDGHIVQGHVDEIGHCIAKKEAGGSTIFTFEYTADSPNMTVEKGSIAINGISLTVVNSQKNSFSVAIIPYTLENTNLGTISIGDKVNLEFDILGKYVAKMLMH